MFDQAQSIYHKLQKQKFSSLEEQYNFDEKLALKTDKVQQDIESQIQELDPDLQNRLRQELEGFGPLEKLMADPNINEILINAYNEIYFEGPHGIEKANDHFFDLASYHQFIERLCNLCKTYINSEKPLIETQWGLYRITLVFPDLTQKDFLLSIRKQPQTRWTIEQLKLRQWAHDRDFELLHEMIQQRENFIVVGGTGSGKTTVLQSLIEKIPVNQRLVVIEDTQEIKITKSLDCSLLTRFDPSGRLRDYTMNDLIKLALRLRPDRICVGEIRGAEATALLMALATGHDGSFGSLHARTAHEALLRLEMLIQMGAPQWSLQSIRRLIGLTIKKIVVVTRNQNQRQLEGIYEISSVEETGITLMKTN